MAARTAPKGKGVDIIEIITLSHDSLPTLSENMRSEGKKRGMMFFLRDADNIEQADAVILIGTRRHPLGLNCAYCGAKTCGENPESNPCAINSIDVGIAIGSACSKAADLRIDSGIYRYIFPQREKSDSFHSHLLNHRLLKMSNSLSLSAAHKKRQKSQSYFRR